MNSDNGVKYGRIGYTGILDESFSPVWNDCRELFRKIVSVRSVLAAKSVCDRIHVEFRHCFRFRGIRYCAVFIPLAQKNYLCRIYPEDRFLKNAFSEMYDFVYSIKIRAMDMFHDTEEFIGCNSDRFPDSGFGDFMQKQECTFEEIFSDSCRILKLFDRSHMSEYVPIGKFLHHTFEPIRKYNSITGKNVLPDINITYKVARINYTVFECSVFTIVRILYMLMSDGETITLKIKDRPDGSVCMSAEYTLSSQIDDKSLNREIRFLRCMISDIGGDVSFFVSDKKISLLVSVPASLSNYVNRIHSRNRPENRPEEDHFEVRGIDELFTRFENDRIGFRAEKTEPDIDLTSLLADVILSIPAA